MCEKSPEFFKVYIPHFSSQQLRIPPAFIKHFNGTIPRKAVLKDCTGKLWHVELEEVGKGLFFQNGWQGFVSDKCLQYGDFLIFSYIQNSIFSVRLFGKDGCNKDNALPFVKITHMKEEKDLESQTDCEPIHACKRKFMETSCRKIENLGSQKVRGHKSRRTAATSAENYKVQVAIQGKARALEAANKFVSKHPFFKIVMTDSYLRKGNLTVPKQFVRKYINEVAQRITLQVSNRSWPVKFVPYGNGFAKFSAGWVAFVQDNTVREEDVCAFELIKMNEIVMKVSIFRCIG